MAKDPSPQSGNDAYFDSAIRHQVGVRRFTAGEVRRLLRLLEAADRDLARKLRDRLSRLPHGRAKAEQLAALLTFIRDLRGESSAEFRTSLAQTLGEFARHEVNFELRMLTEAIPVEVSFSAVPAETLRAVVNSRPFQGRLLREWHQGLEAADAARLRDAIRRGVLEGESIDDIVARVTGTRAAGFRDGILTIHRRQAEAVVRTAINHVSNAAREEVWLANSDIISALRWTSTLDGRTSHICRTRDGDLAPVGGKPLPPGSDKLSPPGARPPAHVNCRSVMVAVLDGVGIVGNRPFVRTTKRRGAREIDFAEEAERRGITVQQARREWAARNIGTVPAKTTYHEWLKRQPAEFQDEVLGRTKGRLFRNGGLTLDGFSDRMGGELTLEELAKTRPESFRAAGMDPGDFTSEG